MSAERTAMTVLGPLPAEDLGQVSIHEHVLVDARNYVSEKAGEEGPSLWPLELGKSGRLRRVFTFNAENLLMDDVDLLVAELAALRAAGGTTIVDMSTDGLRLDVEALADISRRSGVNIVLGTGLYITPTRPERYRGVEERALAAWMTSEIMDGIEGTGIRAGHIGEIGITELDEEDRTLLKAAARAAAETGATISIHPGFSPGKDGRAIADVLEDAGAGPDQVVMGHGDAFVVEHDLGKLIEDPGRPSVQLDYHRELLQRGYNISFDCFGHDWSMEDIDWMLETDWHRLVAVATLVTEGYASQLVLGCDIFAHSLMKQGGGAGYGRVLEWVVPALLRHGASEEDVRKMTVENPARLLGVF
ncbi:MAG: hypothetical protein BGO11_07325 [Solirubrobacterales bacterium 70-9]|nr:MAG: hypothetical protein BGO11_07325 [Solirubrobacterales bacterium 70-9]